MTGLNIQSPAFLGDVVIIWQVFIRILRYNGSKALGRIVKIFPLFGEEFIRCQEVRQVRGQTGLEDRKIRRYEGRLFKLLKGLFFVSLAPLGRGLGRGANQMVGSPDVKLLSVLRTKITSLFSLPCCHLNFCSSDNDPLPSPPPREGACSRKTNPQANNCHCERENGASQSHNIYINNEITTSNASPSPRNDIENSCKTQVSGGAATLHLPQVREAEKRASLLTLHPSLKKHAAFTLAEVLITLGIIGVVAAMTMPSLVSHYQRKVLETQFKKSYSVLSQALLPVQSEFLSCPAGNNAEIRERLFAQFNSIGEGETAELSYDNFFKTYNKKASSGRIHANCLDPNNSNTFSGFGTVTPDGAVISFCTNVTYGNLISIDTNGFKKGPNAFGHDLFFFHLNLNNCNLEPMTGQWRDCTEDDKDCNGTSDTYLGWKWTEGTCSKNSDASENGFACTQYAIANTCPDGSGKGYFDCLP